MISQLSPHLYAIIYFYVLKPGSFFTIFIRQNVLLILFADLLKFVFQLAHSFAEKSIHKCVNFYNGPLIKSPIKSLQQQNNTLVIDHERSLYIIVQNNNSF